jgi:hypothetical protein
MFVRRDGEGMRARVLVHGVVATTVTLPRAPAVDVAIELAGLLPARATVTDMAARIESLQPLLATQAIALLLRFARSPRGEIPTSRILAIFLAASRHASIPELDALPLVDALDPSGSSTRISLAELRRLSEAQRGVLVLDPSHLDENIATRGIVALLDERTRAALTERFGITFRAPPRKARFAAPSRWRSLGALREWLLGGLADLVWAGARPVPFEALTPAERAAHEILAAAIAGTGGAIRSIVWREGKARCHLREGAWVLSRAHPDVRDFVVAVSADPATLYPRALLLLRGHAMVDARLRADFQARMAHAPH